MNTKFLFRIGLGIVAVAVVGFAFWHGARDPQTGATPGPSVSGSPAAASSALPITYTTAPADWQIYSSASLGIKLSYPKGWQAGSCGDSCVAFGPAGSTDQPIIGVNITPQKLVDILSQAAPYQVSKDTIKVGSVTWTKLVLAQPETNAIFVSHFTEHSGNVYEFGLASQDAATVAIYGQMIKSFVFTK